MIEGQSNRPISEGELRQSAAREGQLGKPPPPSPEQVPAQGGRESTRAQPPERRKRASALDILELMAQLHESRGEDLQQHEKKNTLEYEKDYRKHSKKLVQLMDRAYRLYDRWPERDRRILGLYTHSLKWRTGLAQDDRQFVEKVKGMSDGELAEELHTAKKKWEALSNEREVTSFLIAMLTPEQREQRLREKQREYARRGRQRRKEQRRLQAESQQPTQVFPDPPQE
jgi:hypothetical protein